MAIPRMRTAARLIDGGHSAQAVPLLEDLTARFPFYAVPFVLLARAREALGEADGALRAWQQAHFLLPDNPVVQQGIARCTRHLLESRERPIVDDRVDVELTSADQIEVSILNLVYPAAPAPAASGPSAEDVMEALDEDDSEEAFEAGSEAETVPHLRPLGPRSDPGRAAGFPLEDNLDDLIAQLSGARIEPQVDVSHLDDPLQAVPPDTGEVVSETLARIYEKQGKYAEAARVYRLLAEQHPERAGAFREKADELEAAAGDDEDE